MPGLALWHACRASKGTHFHMWNPTVAQKMTELANFFLEFGTLTRMAITQSILRFDKRTFGLI